MRTANSLTCDSTSACGRTCKLSASHGWIHAAWVDDRILRWDHTGHSWTVEPPVAAIIANRLPWAVRARRIA
ncbi:hypothetical protein [Jatrophihabitans sp. GAS493]|uniref:hypothetical protein n=1 Tax=Jatrophihabitans sp. GAS493 TaxID=1907575 RepID=UPI000BB69BC2|nr:hypothetical protein [Jatrophihabitans sp. GAS493]